MDYKHFSKIVHTIKVTIIIILAALSQIKVKFLQYVYLHREFSKKTKDLIIFLVPGCDDVNGGILSISSIYEESIKLKYIHQSEVILCSFPNGPTLLKYTKFSNNNHIFNFYLVLNYFRDLNAIQIHIPEMYVHQFVNFDLNKIHFRNNLKISFNILLQNIDLLGDTQDIISLKSLGFVTCTTAHEQYSTKDIRNKIGVPLHKLSTYCSPEQYKFTDYSHKKDILIVSPDIHPRKDEILRLISGKFPQLNVTIIHNLSYEKYKELISSAKWALTFGEGLDGYFGETIFSGGISFAVFNQRFFTPDFESLATLYKNYDELERKICTDIESLDNKKQYSEYQKIQFDLLESKYQYVDYINNLKSYYLGKYLFP